MAKRRFAVSCPLCGKRTMVSSELDAEFIQKNGCDECNDGIDNEPNSEYEGESEELFEPYDDEDEEIEEER